MEMDRVVKRDRQTDRDRERQRETETETERRKREREGGTELRLPFQEGLSLEIIRLSLTKSSKAEEQDRILKSLSDAAWPVSVRWVKTLEGDGSGSFLPAQAETFRWSEARVCKLKSRVLKFEWNANLRSVPLALFLSLSPSLPLSLSLSLSVSVSLLTTLSISISHTSSNITPTLFL